MAQPFLISVFGPSFADDLIGDSLEIKDGGVVSFRRLTLREGEPAEPDVVLLSPPFGVVVAKPATEEDLKRFTK